jgi:hypothetical protein
MSDVELTDFSICTQIKTADIQNKPAFGKTEYKWETGDTLNPWC